MKIGARKRPSSVLKISWKPHSILQFCLLTLGDISLSDVCCSVWRSHEERPRVESGEGVEDVSAAVARALKVLRTEGGLTSSLVSPVGEIASNNLVKHRKVCPNTLNILHILFNRLERVFHGNLKSQVH